MPKKNKQSIDASLTEDIESYADIPDNRVSETVVQAKLRGCGLTEEQAEMVLLKFYEGRSNSEIAEIFGFSSHRRAAEALKNVFEKLKAAGFSLTDGDC